MVINPVEEIMRNIPELSKIKDVSSNRELVSNRNFNNRLKSISTKNLRKYKQAVTGTSLNNYFSPCIISVHPDDELLEINKDKYKLIRQYVMSEEHHK